VDALQAALDAVLPTFLIIILGAAADRFLPNLSVDTLSRLSIYFLIPALVLGAVAGTDLSLGSALLITLGYLFYLLILGLVSWFGSGGLSRAQRRGVLVASLFGNTGNMGLPITLSAYGQAGLERAVVVLVVSLAAMFAVSPPLLAGETKGLRRRIIQTLKLPPIWATLIGIILNLGDVRLPLSLERGISLLGSAAIPIMLFSLGIQMQRSWVWAVGGAAVRTSGFRMLLGPFIALGCAYILGLPPLDTKVLVLSAAMPVAVTVFVVALEVKGDYQGVARSVVATTVLSLLAVTGVLYFLPA
jgi:predicted permease